ncbi:MAG: hypothetical protein IKS07_08690, partial [Lachnospiraceae bacterium]|nr:hypothetical protein [Lachnospiraceae bacterium]
CICTEIREFCGEVDGEEIREDYIVKRPLSKAGEDHLRRMKESYDLLCNRYDGGDLRIAECELSRTEPVSAAFPFARGVSLEELLDERLAAGDIPGFHGLFREYVRRISYGEDRAVTDYDLIFSNILVDGDTWTVIDYEWTFPERKDSRQVAFRALYCYLLEDESRECCEPDTLLSEMGITPENAEEYRRDEMAFQKRVTKGHLALGELRERIGNACYSVEDLVEGAAGKKAGNDRLQIYEDRGGGFSEEASVFPERVPGTEGEYGASGSYELSVDGACRALRIDPGSRKCLVIVKDLKWNGRRVPGRSLTPVGGQALGDGIYLFDTEDPQLLCSLEKLQRLPSNRLELELAVSEVSGEAARAASPAAGDGKKKGLLRAGRG